MVGVKEEGESKMRTIITLIACQILESDNEGIVECGDFALSTVISSMDMHATFEGERST